MTPTHNLGPSVQEFEAVSEWSYRKFVERSLAVKIMTSQLAMPQNKKYTRDLDVSVCPGNPQILLEHGATLT